MKNKVFALCIILLILISSISFAATTQETFVYYALKDNVSHSVITEVWEYNVQPDGTLTSGHPIDALNSTTEEPHNYNKNGICSKCGHENNVVFEAETELTKTLGIVDISQTVAVYNYFYDRTTKKYSVPMQTEIKQNGIDSWVRVKLNAYRTIRSTGEQTEINWDLADVGILDDKGNLIAEGISDYVIKNEYLYYTKILPKNYTLYVSYYGRFSNYQELYSSSYVGTNPSSDAIQGENFYPDFSTDDPWNNVDIEAREKDQVDNTSNFNTHILEGENFGTITSEIDDENNRYILPGDELNFSTKLEIEGEEGYSYDITQQINFNIEMEQLFNSILENFQVLLSVDNQDFTDITSEEVIKEKTSLGNYIKGQVLNLIYKIKLSESLNNIFESEPFNVLINYKAKISTTPTPSPTSTPSPKPTPSLTPTPIITLKPTISPSPTPTNTPISTLIITEKPTIKPTPTPLITKTPTTKPTIKPTITISPSHTPKTNTFQQTPMPTIIPTPRPTFSPEKRNEIIAKAKKNFVKISPNFEDFTEEELEDLIDIFGYETPLYGILQTGDEIPINIYIFTFFGLFALLSSILLKKRKT